MQAVVLLEARNGVREVPDAEMRQSTDVLPRLTSTAICGKDLHFYEGRMPWLERHVIGHEPLGSSRRWARRPRASGKGIGSWFRRTSVAASAPCASMAIPRHASWPIRVTREPHTDIRTRGEYEGAQAELLRVPFADASCLKRPGEPGDLWEDDFVPLCRREKFDRACCVGFPDEGARPISSDTKSSIRTCRYAQL
jgi:glutathione-independent formaldehyde dehydrogenase